MDQLDRLSLSELIKLNEAVQEEISRRLISLNEENLRLKQESVSKYDNHDVSVMAETPMKQSKNQSWITPGKLIATANRFFIRNNESIPSLQKKTAHKDIVWDVRWCPYADNHQVFATASADRTAKIWSLSEGPSKCVISLGTYTGHSGSVNSIRFHPTQNIICSSSGDHTCHIWKPSLARIQSLAEEDDDGIRSSFKRQSSIETLAISKPMARLISHQGYVTTGEWTSDGGHVLSGSQDTTIKMWDVSDWTKPSLTLTGHDSTISSIAAHPSNPNMFCSSSLDKTIRLWDTRTSSFMLNVLHGHEKGVSFISYDRHNPSILISGSDDCTVKFWDIKTMQCQLTIHTNYVMNHFCQSPKDDMLCLPSKNASAVVYSSQGVPLVLLSGNANSHSKMIYSCDWNENGILTTGLDRGVCLWEINANEL